MSLTVTTTSSSLSRDVLRIIGTDTTSDQTLDSMSQDQGPSRFLSLPAEIRQLIYQYAFEDSYVQVRVQPKTQVIMPAAYNIVLSCRQCYLEAYQLFFESTTMSCGRGVGSGQLSKLFSNDVNQLTRRLYGLNSLYTWSGFPDMNAIFPNLETFVVTVPQVKRFDSLESLLKLDDEAAFTHCVSLVWPESDTYDYLVNKAHFRTYVLMDARMQKSSNVDHARFLIVLDLHNRRVLVGDPIAERPFQKKFRYDDLLQGKRIPFHQNAWVEDGSLTNI